MKACFRGLRHRTGFRGFNPVALVVGLCVFTFGSSLLGEFFAALLAAGIPFGFRLVTKGRFAGSVESMLFYLREEHRNPTLDSDRVPGWDRSGV